MREIKFRAWYVPDRKMMYERDYVCLTLDGKLVDGRCDDGYGFSNPGYGEELNLKNHILMQYTGLKDKNGKEIYEGDILRCGWENDDGPIWIMEWIEKKAAFSMFPDSIDEMNIIGNIYENPELLDVAPKG